MPKKEIPFIMNSIPDYLFFFFMGMILLGGGVLGFDYAKGRVRPLHKGLRGEPCTDLKEKSRWRYLGHAAVTKWGRETDLVFLSPIMAFSRCIMVIEYPPFEEDLEPGTVLTVNEGKLTYGSRIEIIRELVIGLN